MLKKILTSSSIYGLAPYIPRIFSIFLLPLLTAHLNSSDFGIIGTLTAYSSAISVFASLGFLNILYSSFYKYGKYYILIWGRIYSILILWGVVFIFFQIFYLWFLIPDEAKSNRLNILILFTLTSLCSEASLIGNAYYQLNNNPIPIASRTVISGLFFLCINYILVVYYDAGYMGYFIALAASSLVVSLSYIPVLFFRVKILPVFHIKKKFLYGVLKITLPTIPHYYTPFLLTSSNRLVMNYVSTPISKIGEFNIAQQFSNIYDSFLIALNQAVTPFFLREIQINNKENIQKLVYNVFAITLFSSVFFSVWSKEIFYLLIKNEILSKTYPLAIIMIMAQNIKPFYIVNANYCFFFNETKTVLKISLVSGLVSFLGYIIIIPFYGLWGAVIVYFFAMLYMGFSGFYLDFYKKKCNINFKIYYKILLIILLTVVCLLISDCNYKIKIIFSLIFICILIFWYFKNKLNKIEQL